MHTVISRRHRKYRTFTSVVIDNIHGFIPLKHIIRLVSDPLRILRTMSVLI